MRKKNTCNVAFAAMVTCLIAVLTSLKVKKKKKKAKKVPEVLG